MMDPINDEWFELQQKPLEKNISVIAAVGNKTLLIGSLLLIAGLVFAVIVYCANPAAAGFCPYFYRFCAAKIYWTAAIAILAEMGSIILMLSYRSGQKQAEYYRNELIVLRDLSMALKICGNISDEDFEKSIIEEGTHKGETKTTRHKSQKTKMKEEIIETLLSRCAR